MSETSDTPPPRKRPKTPGCGRKNRLDDEMISRVCGQIKKGNTIRTSAIVCGISEVTFYHWRATGNADRSAGKRTRYSAFVEALEHADAVAQQRLVAGILKNAPWKAKLEILKRRFPKEFGDRSALMNPDGSPLAPGGGPPINVNFKFSQPEGDDPFQWDEEARAKADEPKPEA